jgi:hypothetical protein
MTYDVDRNGEIKIGYAVGPDELRDLFNTEKPGFENMHMTWNAVDKHVIIWR